MKTLSVLALSALLLAACQQSDDLASPSAGVMKRSSRGFHANISSTLDLTSVFTPCTGAPLALPDHFLDGEATHMGNLNGELSNLHHDDCDVNLETATLTANVSGQIVGNNGDLIYYTGEDVINIFNFLTGAEDQTGPIEGTWTITGGTGRFEGATGSFTINGTVDFTTTTFTAEATGTIDY